MCPIWEYQTLHKETKSRLSNSAEIQFGIDYTWAGAIVTMSPNARQFSDFEPFIENHGDFITCRRVCQDFQVIPQCALYTATNSKSEESLKLKRNIMKYWCKAPAGFEKAINWVAFDDPYFKVNHNWPALSDSEFWIEDGTY